jgi:uncharacterized Fe-S cluster-containing radical SAM superfamily protein
MSDRTTSLKVINTDRFSARLRARGIDLSGRRLLMTRLTGSDQEKDLTCPANCRGLGRVRHFRRDTSPGWPPNSLPIDPASKALGLEPGGLIRAQVFQNSVCNWRCWYCFVDFSLLNGDETRSEWVTADELVRLFREQPDPPSMIDLTGGQPDLTPEWVPWMMDALEAAGLQDSVYLWSDDNLSNDYFWQYLDAATRRRIALYPKYGRVCCFKGYNAESFAFNTMAAPELFERQFDLMKRLMEIGLDLYAYVTLTTPSADHVNEDMSRFVDKLQQIDRNLPLRTIPLEIRPFTPVLPRMDDDKRRAIDLQQQAIARWRVELDKRFSAEELGLRICDVPLQRGGGRHG